MRELLGVVVLLELHLIAVRVIFPPHDDGAFDRPAFYWSASALFAAGVYAIAKGALK